MLDAISLFSSSVFVGTLIYVVLSKRKTKVHFTENMTKFNSRLENSKKEMELLNKEINDKALLFQTMIGDGNFEKARLEALLREEGEDAENIRSNNMSNFHNIVDLPKHRLPKKILHNG